jgi:hypothetical protein
MKWYGWSIFSLVLLAGALSALALEPSSRRGFMRPAVIALEESQAHERPAPPAPVHYRLVAGSIWAGTYDGYVYEPGACDYKPPCVDHLWDGYCMRPLRCDGLHFGLWGCRGCGHCGHLGRCGHRGHCGLFGHHGCGCGDKVGCDVKAPDCGIAAKPSCGLEDDCGCDGGWHFGHHFRHGCRHFWHRCKAHWTGGCGADIGCGCGMDMKGAPTPVAPDGAPPAPMPDAGEKSASLELEAKSDGRTIRLPAIGTGLRSYFRR